MTCAVMKINAPLKINFETGQSHLQMRTIYYYSRYGRLAVLPDLGEISQTMFVKCLQCCAMACTHISRLAAPCCIDNIINVAAHSRKDIGMHLGPISLIGCTLLNCECIALHTEANRGGFLVLGATLDIMAGFVNPRITSCSVLPPAQAGACRNHRKSTQAGATAVAVPSTAR